MRAAVIAEAMTWMGTPHANGQRVRGAGVDCGQFPAAVFEACGLIEHVEVEPYPHDWHLHRSEERYLEQVERFFQRLPEGECPLPGDLALYSYGRCISHGAIVTAWPQVVHAYIPPRASWGEVLLDDTVINLDLRSRLVGVWRLKQWS